MTPSRETWASMMLAQAFRRVLHRIRQSLTGLSLNTPLSTLFHPQPPAKPPRRPQPRPKSRHLRLGTFNVDSIGYKRKQHETLPCSNRWHGIGFAVALVTFGSSSTTTTRKTSRHYVRAAWKDFTARLNGLWPRKERNVENER